MSKPIIYYEELKGQKINRITLIKPVNSFNPRRYWKCECECGNTFTADIQNIRRGITKSCGCLRNETMKKNKENSKIRKEKHMKTLSQLKRDLKVGVKLKQTFCNWSDKNLNTIRAICKTQSNCIYLEDQNTRSKTSRLDLPKANELEYIGNTFKIYQEPNKYNNFERTLAFVYEIVE